MENEDDRRRSGPSTNDIAKEFGQSIGLGDVVRDVVRMSHARMLKVLARSSRIL